MSKLGFMIESVQICVKHYNKQLKQTPLIVVFLIKFLTPHRFPPQYFNFIPIRFSSLPSSGKCRESEIHSKFQKVAEQRRLSKTFLSPLNVPTITNLSSNISPWGAHACRSWCTHSPPYPMHAICNLIISRNLQPSTKFTGGKSA